MMFYSPDEQNSTMIRSGQRVMALWQTDKHALTWRGYQFTLYNMGWRYYVISVRHITLGL